MTVTKCKSRAVKQQCMLAMNTAMAARRCVWICDNGGRLANDQLMTAKAFTQTEKFAAFVSWCGKGEGEMEWRVILFVVGLLHARGGGGCWEFFFSFYIFYSVNSCKLP